MQMNCVICIDEELYLFDTDTVLMKNFTLLIQMITTCILMKNFTLLAQKTTVLMKNLTWPIQIITADEELYLSDPDDDCSDEEL
jgi:hypothetical protein